MTVSQLFDVSAGYGRLRLRGASRLGFLHRMSTGDLARLQPGQGACTVLTTPIGRSIDFLTVLAQPESLLVITGQGNQDKVGRWLRKFILYNDDVQVVDETASTRMILAVGDGLAPSADSRLREALAGLPEAVYAHSGSSSTVVRWPWPNATAFALILPSDAAIPNLGGPLGDWAGFEAARVAAGVPRFPNEIGEDYVPLETGLWGAISFSKGCYTGQEIIARMESRGQIAKKLVMLGDLPGGAAAGDELRTEAGLPVGIVTSVAGEAGLGYVRTAAIEIDGQLQVAGKGSAIVRQLVRAP